MPLFSSFLHVEPIGRFLAHTVEIVKDTQSFIGFQFHAFTAEPAEVGNQIRTDTGKLVSCVLHILFIDRNGHILILHDGIGTRGLFKQNFVVFLPVLVEPVAF